MRFWQVGVAEWRDDWKTMAQRTCSENCEGGSDLCSGASGTDDLRTGGVCVNSYLSKLSIGDQHPDQTYQWSRSCPGKQAAGAETEPDKQVK